MPVARTVPTALSAAIALVSLGLAMDAACAQSLAAAPIASTPTPLSAASAPSPVSAASSPVASAADTPAPAWSVALRAGIAQVATDALDSEGRRLDGARWLLQPSARWRRDGPGLKVDADAALLTVGAEYGAAARVHPQLDAHARLRLVDQLLWLDAAASVATVGVQPLLLVPDPMLVAADELRTARSWRLAPRLHRQWAQQGLTLDAHHALSVLRGGSGMGIGQTLQDTLVRLESAPRPYGGALVLTRLHDHRQADDGIDRSLATVRGEALFRPDAELLLAAWAGLERSRIGPQQREGGIYGVRADWQPGPRTRLTMDAAHRIDGNVGRLTLSHRTPFLAMTLGAERTLTLESAALGETRDAGDLRSLLDAMLTTRIADPETRRSAVDQLLRSQTLQTQPAAPVWIASSRPQQATRWNAAVALLGRRSIASLTLYGQTARTLALPGMPPAHAADPWADSTQRGAALQVAHRLGPRLSVAAMLAWSRIEATRGAGAPQGRSMQARIAADWRLAPRSDLVAGVQRVQMRSDVTSPPRADFTQVHVGIEHRF